MLIECVFVLKMELFSVCRLREYKEGWLLSWDVGCGCVLRASRQILVFSSLKQTRRKGVRGCWLLWCNWSPFIFFWGWISNRISTLNTFFFLFLSYIWILSVFNFGKWCHFQSKVCRTKGGQWVAPFHLAFSFSFLRM